MLIGLKMCKHFRVIKDYHRNKVICIGVQYTKSWFSGANGRLVFRSLIIRCLVEKAVLILTTGMSTHSFTEGFRGSFLSTCWTSFR